MSVAEIESSVYLAASEDGETVWYDRRGFTKARALADTAADCLMHSNEFRAVARWMREFKAPRDCWVNDHEFDPDCECCLEDEGFWVECKRGDEDAIPVWKVDAR